jgi:CHAT domain-containing protein/tetratricopeptide (TPR) repeat protein
MSSLNGNLTSLEIAQKLLLAHLAGDFEGAAVTVAPTLRLKALLHTLEIAEVDYALIEQFKKLVDQRICADARDALQVADLTASLSQLSPDPAARALGARTKAMALHVTSRYQEAVDNYERARQLYRRAGRAVERARVERAMVDALLYQGRYEEALALADEARQVFEQTGEELLLAQLESNVGNLYHRLDRNAEALAHYERAAEIFARVAPEQLAQVTFNRANIYCNLDDFSQALRLYEQAYDLHYANENHLGAVQTRYSIGYLYFLMGSYHQAMRVMHEVHVECQRLGDEQTAALCIMDLAEIYLQMNILDEAAEQAAQARALFLTLGMRYEGARSLTLLGLAELRQRKWREAECSLAQAQAEFAAEGNEVHQGLVNLYRAELYLQREAKSVPATLTLALADAIKLAEAAEAIFAEQQLKAKICAARLIKARALLAGGQAVRELGEAILRICQELESPALRYQAHELLGDVQLAAGELEQAHLHYTEAISLVEQIRGGIRVDDFRSAFFRDKLRVYDKQIRLCLEQPDQDRQAEAFYYLESSKARTLVDMLVHEQPMLPSAANPAFAALHEEWQRLRTELHWHSSKVNRAETLGLSRLSHTDVRVRKEVLRCERALADVTRRLQATDPGFVWFEHSSGISVEELRRLLAADELVIEYYFDRKRLKLFVIDQTTLQVLESAATLPEINEQIQQLRFQFDKFQYGHEYVTTHAARLQESTNECLHQLWQALFAPVAELAAGKKLIIIPHGVLHNVPFQALFDGTQYLLDAHEITQAPSARLLQLCAERAPEHYASVALFGAADAVAPQITNEIQAIASLFPHQHCFTGAAATADALAKYAPQSDVLHIASHAVFRHDNPMFSAFKLADAWVNFYDICALKLPASLVVLSGCSTGASRVHAGDELMGLARGFLSAGAAALVVSLWAVNDPATAQLITAFYQRLRAGQPIRTALRTASLEIKASFEHPYYWAPFILLSHH